MVKAAVLRPAIGNDRLNRAMRRPYLMRISIPGPIVVQARRAFRPRPRPAANGRDSSQQQSGHVLLVSGLSLKQPRPPGEAPATTGRSLAVELGDAGGP